MRRSLIIIQFNTILLRRFLKIIVLLLTIPFPLLAQEDIFSFSIYVRDAFTRETMRDVYLELMDADNNEIPQRIYPHEVIKRSGIYRYFVFLPRLDRYIIKVSKEGYDPLTDTVTVKKSEKEKEVELILHKSPIKIDEVTVLGSKVLMVNRGDTIVYNAEAFQLSNGSMLDALIRQLPGVQLKGNRITVNGQFVSSLLVNGRDFFKGDPKIALENLPAYYVDKVKVYHQISRIRQVMEGDSAKADINRDPLVMDVNLKRDYAEGWLGNADVASGTHNKYLVRLFAMRYTKHSGLFAFGNINNLSDDQSADKDGNWSSRILNDGIVRTKTFGISFEGIDKMTGMEYGTSARLALKDGEYEHINSSDNYYATGDIFQRRHSLNNNKSTNLKWEGKWDYSKIGNFDIYFAPSFSYEKNDNRSLSYSANFSIDQHEAYRGAAIDSLYAPLGSRQLTEAIINKRKQQSFGKSDNLNLYGSLFSGIHLLGRWIRLDARGNYINSHSQSYMHDFLSYNIASGKPDDKQNKYRTMPSMSYKYQLDLTLPNIAMIRSANKPRIEIGYGYQQQYSSGERQLYRLDTDMLLGNLPSTTDSMQAAIDISNSYQTSTLEHRHTANVIIYWNRFQLILPISFIHEHINDRRMNHYNSMNRYKVLFNTHLFYGTGNLQVDYRFEQSLPTFNYLLNVRDDADPLFVSLGNTDLHNSQSHRLNLFYRAMKTEWQRQIKTAYSLYFLPNAIGISRFYDMATGVTTTRPDNINGNWGTSVDFSYGQQVDKGRRLSLTTSSNANYVHSVDYATIQVQDNSIASRDRNTVNNIGAGETLKVEYRLGSLYAAATASLNWKHAESKAGHFKTVNALDYNYGLALTKRMMRSLNIDTEIMMWSRRGYIDKTMNSNELLWNASISYSFGEKGQWVIKAEGHDLLHCQNSVRQTMNEQGRTETWYKMVPSYFLFHLIYQFKKAPTKKM